MAPLKQKQITAKIYTRRADIVTILTTYNAQPVNQLASALDDHAPFPDDQQAQ